MDNPAWFQRLTTELFKEEKQKKLNTGTLKYTFVKNEFYSVVCDLIQLLLYQCTLPASLG